MAIIYTYPTKTSPTYNDLVLISDSEDNNSTKNATITSIKDTIDVVDSVTANFGTYILGTDLTAATGAVDFGNINLSAVDGTAVAATRFLSKDNTWDTPPTYTGGANVGYVPDGGSVGQYLDGTGNWVTASTGTVTGTGTANTVPLFSSASAIGDSIITQPYSQQVNISSTSNSAPATLQIPISTGSGPNATLGGVNIYGGVYNVAQPNISPSSSTGIIQFGSATSGQTFDFRNNKIAFDSDTTNTFIKANTLTPESLEIHADQDIQLRPDGYVVIFTGAAAPTTAGDSGDQGSIVYDDNYLYVCVQDDTWKRVALSSW